MGTLPYAWSGTDAQGNPRAGSGSITTSSTALFGRQFATGTVGALPAAAVPTARIYFQPGDFTGTAQPTWTNQTLITQAVNAGATSFLFSMKDATAAAMTKWRAFLRTIPAAYRDDTWCVWMHEHEAKIRQGSLTFAAYDAGSDLVRVATQAEGFKFGPLHNGLNRNAADTAWIFGNYVEPTNLALCDFEALDCYDDNGKGAAALFFSATGWWPYFRDVGKPILIGEYGTPTGPNQAALAAGMKAECLARPQIKRVHYWDQMFTNNPDYRMTAATAATWYA